MSVILIEMEDWYLHQFSKGIHLAKLHLLYFLTGANIYRKFIKIE